MSVLPTCDTLLLDLQDGVLTITLNRPHKRNAMNAALVGEMMAVFDSIAGTRDIRAVILQGSEQTFCSGGDISDMNAGGEASGPQSAIWHFNRSFGHLITRVNAAPQVVITLLQGAVLGGGFGLACVSDVAIADRQAQFALPETMLGIVPAQIAPFVVSRIGLTQARRLALLGERIDGVTAHELGIAHFLTDGWPAMEKRLKEVLAKVRQCAPGANALTKEIMLQVGVVEHEHLLDKAATAFSQSLEGKEGKEGTHAFLNKRKPNWAK
ncbi:enoyl-CoA hydratase/isomerase family protein [Kineobactrum salinum]|uniref:Enoyl-CoA hydratase/isomerase family protein n=1 Tax=Kineobactrum salinum TaxID=2708301 RepID=A0A6C0U421_9GAMM|nr:enoyl-CoA hydratase-related protein [Kineobactrum salinum]QIB66890.1 enoyl-CoA hydratase/isomerase family protein [Kineobactrum salinum]